MTLIRPHKTKELVRGLIGFFACLAVLGGFYIFHYARYAEFRREIAATEKEIFKAKDESALLKQEYFTLTDPSRLREAAEAEGMILDRRPQYLTYLR